MNSKDLEGHVPQQAMAWLKCQEIVEIFIEM